MGEIRRKASKRSSKRGDRAFLLDIEVGGKGGDERRGPQTGGNGGVKFRSIR